MSEISKNIVSLIISKEFHKAKTLIHEAMNNKLGLLLEEKLLEYGPTLYEDTDITDDPEYQKEQKKKEKINKKHSENDNIGVDFDKLAKIQQETNPGAGPPTDWHEYSDIEDHDKNAQKAWDKAKANGLVTGNITPEFVSNRDEAASEQAPGQYPLYPTRGYKKPDAVNNALDTARTITNPLSWVPIVPYVADEILNKTASMRQKFGILGRGRAAIPYPGVANVANATNKFLLPLIVADEAIDAAKSTYNDDWKNSPWTSAANLGVDLAKRAAITSLYTPAAPFALLAAAGGYVGGLGLAYAHDKITGAKKEEGNVALMHDLNNYKPKNIVAGAKSWVDQFINGDPYAAVNGPGDFPSADQSTAGVGHPRRDPKQPWSGEVTAGTVRNSNGQVMYK